MNHSLVGKTAAANMCERINKLIRNFEKSLAPDEVAAMSLASFSNRPIIIKRLGYWNPDLIVLYGFDPNTGEALKMIQHISENDPAHLPVYPLPDHIKASARR